MSLFPRRGWSSETPCSEYAKFQRIAEELVANIGETASPEVCEQVQKRLLFLFQQLQQGVDPLHFRFPGGHPCLEHAYLQYAMRVANRAVLYKPVPLPQPRQPLTTPEAVVEDLGETIQHHASETVLGEDKER